MLAWIVVPVVLGVWYGISLKRRPQRRCWRCGGSKLNEDTTMFRGAIGRCWVCKGTGKRTRWGVMIFMRKTFRSIKSGQAGRNY